MGFRGDGKVRCLWRNIKCPPAIYCCDYCEAPGVFTSSFDQIEDVFRQEGLSQKQPGDKLVWPETTADGRPRTKERMAELAANVDTAPRNRQDMLKGVKGLSILEEYQSWDLNPVTDVHVDYMHTFAMGVVKRFVECLYFPSHQRSKKCKPYPKGPVDDALLTIKVPCEFSRRTRFMDHSNYKGAEYRDTGLFYFPAVVNNLHRDSVELRAFSQMCFLLRAVILPIQEFDAAGIDLKYEQSLFYHLYQKALGVEQCVYNAHMIGAHSHEFKRAGNASVTSCFLFEGFFSKFSNWFEPGTLSAGKQIMTKALESLLLDSSEHRHRRPLIFNDKETETTQNNIFYTWSENTGYHFYKCKHLLYNGDMLCHALQHGKGVAGRVDFSRVGAFKRLGFSEELVRIRKCFIRGHAIEALDWIITVPSNCIIEQLK